MVPIICAIQEATGTWRGGCEPAGLIRHTGKVFPVLAGRHPRNHLLKSGNRQLPAQKRRFLGTADLDAGALLDGLHVGGGFVQTRTGTGVEPGEAAGQAHHPQFAAP